MRSVIPPMQIATVLPGAICALTPVLLLGFARRLGRAHAAVLLPPALYGIFVLLLGAFTNGAHSRYLTPLLGFNLIGALIIFAIAAEKRRDGVDVTRRCPGGAT
jgi:hypothetical protein